MVSGYPGAARKQEKNDSESVTSKSTAQTRFFLKEITKSGTEVGPDLDPEFSRNLPPRGYFFDLGHKGPKREPKGAKRQPKGIKKSPKASQRAPKRYQQ